MANPLLDTAEVPQFSVKHGFYKDSLDITVSSATPNSTIQYTLDCSDPRSSPTALQKTSPAAIHIDPQGTEGHRDKSPCVIVRACTVAPDFSVSDAMTQTYVFVDQAGSLSPEGVVPGTKWPPTSGLNGQSIDYGMAPVVLNDPRYKDLISASLLAIPTISVATDLKNLFAVDSGIYVNAMQDGKAWERPASIELINPDSTDGFQINAGIRIRGGWSRHGDDPKHAFRLFFRTEYGKGKLDYPLFDSEGVSKFDKVDLRTGQNYAWSYPGHQGRDNTMISEVFCRDLQREMNQPYTRSRFYHLYLNGVYWGLFQTQERPEARYAASYFGGNVDDYDVIKIDDGYSIEATDGNTNAYHTLWNYCAAGFRADSNYFKLQGLNPNGTQNPSFRVLVDIDNLIDYMLVIFYSGNFDSPTSKFGSNKSPNNFYAIYDRNRNDGFKFFVHDAEHTLRTRSGEGPGIGLSENRVNIGTLTDDYKMTVSGFSVFHPQWLHFRLSDNAEYRLRFADHAYRRMYNQGCMTPEKAMALFLSRAKEIEMAIIGESARWGNTYLSPAATKDDDWRPAINEIVNNYFPYRTAVVLDQLKAASLYPMIDPPIFENVNQEVLKVQPGYILKLQNQNTTPGTIRYTVDGQDPRAIGGVVASSAKDGGNEVDVTVTATTVVQARFQNGTDWSALHKIILFVGSKTDDLKITEIHYHPLDSAGVSGNEYEFLELKNIGASPIDLSQAAFADGISYTFPSGAIVNPKEFIVLASNAEEFSNRYGFLPNGEYNGQLDNSGERITLCDAGGDTLITMTYGDKAPWPESPDGGGYSLVTKVTSPKGDLNDPSNWRASSAIHGSPGRDDPASTLVENPPAGLVNSFALHQNYPNPFNPTTKISYQLKVKSYVTITVRDLLGREVATLVCKEQSLGSHSVEWDAAKYSSGVYFYQLRAQQNGSGQGGSFVETKKMVLIK